MVDPRDMFSPSPRPGVTLVDDGAIFCVFAGHASLVELCLFTLDSRGVDIETRRPMEAAEGGTWSVFVGDAGPGTRYGFRAHGRWAPREGHRYNPAKLLLDPYARAVEGEVIWRPEVFGHVVDDDFQGDSQARDDRDSAPFVPRSVVVDEAFDWGDDEARRPRIPMADTVLYEAHVKGFSERHPAVFEPLRGTYSGLATPASVQHLLDLGVTSVELLPVHAFTDEPHLVKLGLSNYWGYNTLGFFAPHGAYATATDLGDPQDAVDEFKSMVKSLHAAGLEVILDVVYNHTAEQGGHEGATLSLRGLDNAAYYRLDAAGHDVDVTGCGNSVDARHPASVQLLLDSLRYWVREMHVDGFRFDLAVTLGRGPGDDFAPDSPLLTALRADPVLSEVKLIAEPWDIGLHGWRTGHFPAPFSEWNDRFRNTVRDFWLTDVARDARGEAGHGVADLATRLAGSRDLFDGPLRRPQASINYVTAHDGFTLADLTAYAHKHNGANGEDNRDGTDDNRSWNHGVEGPSDDQHVVQARYRTVRNLLGTLILSSGVPMLTAGDEVARTQRGNNNAYCQDSALSWLEWQHTPDQRELFATTKHLIELRSRFSVVRHTTFFPGTSRCGDPDTDLRWFGVDGEALTATQWQDGRVRTLQAFFDGSSEHEESLLLVLHGGADEADVVLPQACGVTAWQVVWDSADPDPAAADAQTEAVLPAGSTRRMAGPSMLALTPRR